MDIMNTCPRRSDETASRIIEGEAVIVVPQEGLVRTLNEVGAFIWNMADGKHAVKDMIEKVSEEFEADKKEATKDLLDFVMELESKGMVKLG